MPQWEKQVADYQVFDVRRGSPEWNEIEQHFRTTHHGMNTTLVRIERNQNKAQFMFYYLRRQQIALRSDARDPNEKYLFHGSRADAYDLISALSSLLSCFSTSVFSLREGHLLPLLQPKTVSTTE